MKFTLLKMLRIPLLGLLALIGGNQVQKDIQPVAQSQVQTLGDFNPTGGGSYRLQSSVGVSSTVINLSSFKEPISGLNYTMAYLGSSIAYGTLDPQQPTKSEFISFTGITQNSDGSAQLTGITRGLSRTPGTGGCVASTTLTQSHSGQSFFILSNSPCFYSEYAVKRNNENITGLWTVLDPVSAQGIASRNYVDGKAFGGIGGATETATGTVEIATGPEAAASTMNGSAGRLALPSSLSTSTYNTATAGNRIVVTQNATGKIDPYFIATSSLGLAPTVNATFTGTTTMASTTINAYTPYGCKTVTSTSTLSITSVIPQNDNSKIIISASTTVADVLQFTFNGDNGSNYYQVYDAPANVTGTSVISSAQTSLNPAIYSAASALYYMNMDLLNLTTAQKMLNISAFLFAKPGVVTVATTTKSVWMNDSRASTITLTAISGSLAPNSKITVCSNTQ